MFSYIRQTSVVCTIVRNVHTNVVVKKTEHVNKYWQHVVNNCENALTQPDTVSKETWESLRKHISESQCNPSIVDFIVLDMFQHKEYPDAGISYYKFLQDNNYNPAIPITTKYLQLYNLKSDPISEPDKEHILNLYDYIKNQYVLFDEYLSNALVECLCKIDKWKEAIEIIKKNEENDKTFLRCGYTSLISYLFDHDKQQLGYEYLTHSLKNNIGPYNRAYTAYLKYCLKKKDTFNINVEKLFLLWSRYGIKPSQNIAFQYMNACMECGWSVSKTIVSRSRCKSCNEDVTEIDLTDKEYKQLFEATKIKLIFNKMYYVTVPEEIQAYIKFIDDHKPYDIIIDGLNMFISNNVNHQLVHEVVKILQSYKRQNKKTLIIARKHMKCYIDKLDLQFADCFYVKNISKDDLFLLYAAFASGKHAKVISKDLMRQHQFALQDIELNVLFKKWQLSHQFVINAKQGCVQLNAQSPIDAIVQKKNNNWHIPYIATDKMPRKRHIFNSHWICFKMN